MLRPVASRAMTRDDGEMTGKRTLEERRVLLAGGTSEAGWAIAHALREGGARVIVAGRSPDKLVRFAGAGFQTMRVDLTDAAAVNDEIGSLDALDGLIPLVGGWRGGGGIPGQSDDDWAFLEAALTTVRHTCRAAWPLLDASPAARVAVVSSTMVTRPIAGSANYAGVKAATEAWIHAVAHGFAKAARDAGRDQTGSATIFRVDQLAGREQSLANGVAALWDTPATDASARIETLA